MLMMLLFIGCGNKALLVVEPEFETTTITTTMLYITEELFVEESTKEELTEPFEEITIATTILTTRATTTMRAPLSPYVPPANLGQRSQDEQLAYFNMVANRVRRERPGFVQRSYRRVENISNTGIPIPGASLSFLIPPDESAVYTVVHGQDNTGQFLSANANASDLRMRDITSIASTRSGNNWMIEVHIARELPPNWGTGGNNARIHAVRSEEEIFDNIMATSGEFSERISINPEDVWLRYSNSFVRFTINAQGQVISAESGYSLEVALYNATIDPIITNILIRQAVQHNYSNFVWA